MINGEQNVTSPESKKPTVTAPSPWKRPKTVSMVKTKSLKRKLDIFNFTLNNESQSSTDSQTDKNSFQSDSTESSTNENQYSENLKPSKLRKIGFEKFNKFSVYNSLNIGSSLSQNVLINSNFNHEKDDLSLFFNQSSHQEAALEQSGSSSTQQETLEVSAKKNEQTNYTYCQSVIKEMCSSISNEKDLNSVKEKKYPFEHEHFLPFDLSLKTRCRFLSKKQYSCVNGIKSQQESDAILNFSKFNCFYENLDKHKIQSNQENTDLFRTLLGEATSYWTFPYLPWLSLYPRNLNFGNLASEPLNPDIQKSLSKSWNQSFKSLFNSLKTNQCPYFYVLTHTFMVLFKSETIGVNNEMTAILTPSTKGFRESLKDIEFTMPLAPQSKIRKSNSNDEFGTAANNNNNESSNSINELEQNNEVTAETSTSSDSQKKSGCENSEKLKLNKDELENNDTDEDEEADEWLDQIGLNTTVNFKSSVLQRNSKNMNKDSLFNFDNRPKSTLLFSSGGEVQALFNYLVNSKTCMLNSGPLTGVPPTLLSPLPFVGANLQKIKIEQNVIKSLSPTGESLIQYALDLIGPIMPYHIHRLAHLLRATQEGNGFSMIASVYEQSTGLNCAPKQENDGQAPSHFVKASYLDSAEWKAYEAGYGIFGEAQAIRSLLLNDKDKFCANFAINS